MAPDKPQALGVSQASLEALVARYAAQYGAKASSMLRTLECEAQGLPDGSYDPKAQSGHVRSGVREDSWGLAQINLPSWPGVLKSQAQDPDFAVEFMAQKFAAGSASLWTCWRLHH